MLTGILKRTPLLGTVARSVLMALRRRTFQSSSYWEGRYAIGGTSGPGSQGRLAAFKADVVNCFAEKNNVQSVIEFGCGDGRQLSLACYSRYIGLDISPTAVATCRERFAEDDRKQFFLYKSGNSNRSAEMALSLDVIYHLIEDEVFETYMTDLFNAAERYVLIYSDNRDSWEPGAPHVRHRKFTNWIASHRPDWKLILHKPNPYPYAGDPEAGSWSDFWIYARNGAKSWTSNRKSLVTGTQSRVEE
jgi:SAM-dependent methyltransferase